MTVAAKVPSKEYIENGVTAAFGVPFRFKAPQHVRAQRIALDGSVVELAYGTDYSVAGGATDAGGTLTVAAPAAAGVRLVIRRATPRVQDMDYATSDTFPAESHEGALDKQMLVAQEQDVVVGDLTARALLVPAGQSAPWFDPAGLVDGDILEFRDGKLKRQDMLASAGMWAVWNSAGQLASAAGAVPAGVPALARYIGGDDGANVQDALAVAANPPALVASTKALAVGSTVRTADGYLYTVLSPMAADCHVETAGGMKLDVLPIDGWVSTAAWGATTPAARNAALSSALASFPAAIVSAGEYEDHDFAQSDKRIRLAPGAWFKMRGGVTDALTAPVATVNLTGSNLRFEGDLHIDGNLAENDTAGMDTSLLRGAFNDAGTNNRVEGNIFVRNASQTGFSLGGRGAEYPGTDGVKSTGFRCTGTVHIENSRRYSACLFWCEDFDIARIEYSRGPDNEIADARLRPGTSTGSPAYMKCSGRIGVIKGRDMITIEDKASGLVVDHISCAGIKAEAAEDIQIGSIAVDGSLIPAGKDAQAFGIQVGTKRVQIGSVSVRHHAGLQPACTFSAIEDVHIGSLLVEGTVGNVIDCRIRGPYDGFVIDSLMLVNPVGTGTGLDLQTHASYEPQLNGRIGSVVSRGHSGFDVSLATGPQLNIGYINPDATKAGRAVGWSNYDGFADSAAVALVTGGGSATLNGSFNQMRFRKMGRMVFVNGQIRLSAVSSPTGALSLTGLPFALTNLTQMTEAPCFTIQAQSMVPGNEGQYYGTMSQGSSTLLIGRFNGTTGALEDAASALQSNSILTISGFYETDAG